MRGFKDGSDQISDSDIYDAAIQKALRNRAFEQAALAVGTTENAIKKLLAKSVKEGTGTQELAREIKRMFDVQKSRSLTIARTELTGVINYGVDETLKSEGYPQKEWSTVLDGQERETHRSADGQTVGVNDQFTVGGHRCKAPGDPNLPVGELANCRCTLVAAGTPEDRRQALNKRFLRVHGALERKFVISLRSEFSKQRDRVLSHFSS